MSVIAASARAAGSPPSCATPTKPPKGQPILPLPVLILDIDYRYDDGTQEHFINRKDVLTCSIHGDPNKDFPFITGHKKETGKAKGKGTNRNYPLPLKSTIEPYLATLKKATKTIKDFNPKYLVIAAGFDTCSSDPVGHFKILIENYNEIGLELDRLGLPTLICQEGGYDLEGLGPCVFNFPDGFLEGRRVFRSRAYTTVRVSKKWNRLCRSFRCQ